MSAYMRELAALVDEVRNGGVSAADVDVPTGSEDWRDLARFTAGARRPRRSLTTDPIGRDSIALAVVRRRCDYSTLGPTRLRYVGD